KHRRQLALQRGTEPRLEVVQQPELVDAAALPPRPQRVRIAVRLGRVALDDDDLVPVATQQHRRRQPDDTRTQYDDSRHDAPSARRGGYPGPAPAYGRMHNTPAQPTRRPVCYAGGTAPVATS